MPLHRIRTGPIYNLNGRFPNSERDGAHNTSEYFIPR